jgi:hypothetical protein
VSQAPDSTRQFKSFCLSQRSAAQPEAEKRAPNWYYDEEEVVTDVNGDVEDTREFKENQHTP